MGAFFPEISEQEINTMSVLALAHVGDAVYELLVRSELCARGPAQINELHKKTVSIVRASAQAAAAKRLAPLLSSDELAAFKRGRNAKVNSVPHHADVGQYHVATGLETLFGWLYMQGRIARINELFAVIMEGVDHAS